MIFITLNVPIEAVIFLQNYEELNIFADCVIQQNKLEDFAVLLFDAKEQVKLYEYLCGSTQHLLDVLSYRTERDAAHIPHSFNLPNHIYYNREIMFDHTRLRLTNYLHNITIARIQAYQTYNKLQIFNSLIKEKLRLRGDVIDYEMISSHSNNLGFDNFM